MTRPCGGHSMLLGQHFSQTDDSISPKLQIGRIGECSMWLCSIATGMPSKGAVFTGPWHTLEIMWWARSRIVASREVKAGTKELRIRFLVPLVAKVAGPASCKPIGACANPKKVPVLRTFATLALT